FQAEDGIRDRNVTGVQTCALPIWSSELQVDMKTNTGKHNKRLAKTMRWARNRTDQELSDFIARFPKAAGRLAASLFRENYVPPRSEERRVGKECSSRASRGARRRE